MLAPRPPLPPRITSDAAPAWSNIPAGPALVRALRDSIGQQPPLDTPTYWQIEAHLRLAHELQTGAGQDQECRREYGWVLAHTAPHESQHLRAKAGLSRLTGEGGFHHAGTLRRATWGALAERPEEMDRASSMWEWITVHHSAMAVDSRVHSRQSVGHQAVRSIQFSHMNARGYGDVGYHFLVDPAGRVYEGRSLRWQGAHALGQNNVGNIGICLLGNFENTPPTRQAQTALHSLVDSLRLGFAIGATHVVGHDHWTSTQCPGRHLRPALRRYR
jgi:hypothetical protein